MEVIQYGSGCGYPIADTGPSSVTQLPILTALHARFPTLFVHIIHKKMPLVNTFLRKLERNPGLLLPKAHTKTIPETFLNKNFTKELHCNYSCITIKAHWEVKVAHTLRGERKVQNDGS